MPTEQPGVVDPFNRDVAENAGYRYTTNAALSSRLANRRLTDLALAATGFRGRTVVDVGCGDGTYTFDLYDEGHPSSMHGIDPAALAIEAAQRNSGSRAITFSVDGAGSLPFGPQSFDIAHLRGVLHHMDEPRGGIAEALRVAKRVVIIEPNGYNPILKLLERFSAYHRDHAERSFTHRRLDGWIRESGGLVVSRRWAGLVPFFCPTWFARLLKRLEPLIEALPVVKQLSCAVYVVVAEPGPK
jgi:SAM-dependent methyltransferase